MAQDNVPLAGLPDRRAILKLLAAGGMALSPLGASEAAAQVDAPAHDADAPLLPRGFADPLLELTRLLRRAAEHQHAFVLQYLYAALSLKPGFESIGGFGSGDATNLVGAAIARMMDLGAVNRLLYALGAPPCLTPPRFPFTPDRYPFAFSLEGLSRPMLARQLYHEATPGFFAAAGSDSSKAALAGAVLAALGAPPTRTPSLYGTIIAVAGEVSRSGAPDLPDLALWIKAMRAMEEDGRDDRFELFTTLFLGSHPALAEHGEVWLLPPADARYPSYTVPVNPASDTSQPPRGDDGTAALVRLGNLQYWTSLLLLDLSFRQRVPPYRDLAVMHMTKGLRPIGAHLAALGAGLAFDAIEVPDSSVLDAKRRLRFVGALLHEGQAAAESIGTRLPPDYPIALNRETMARLGIT